MPYSTKQFPRSFFCEIKNHRLAILKDTILFGIAFFVVDVLLRVEHLPAALINAAISIFLFVLIGTKYTKLTLNTPKESNAQQKKLAILFLISGLIVSFCSAITSTEVLGNTLSAPVRDSARAIATACILATMSKKSWGILIPREFDAPRAGRDSKLPFALFILVLAQTVLLIAFDNMYDAFRAEGISTTAAYLVFFFRELLLAAITILFFVGSATGFLLSRGIAK